jgi:hypothetical protein
MATGPRTDSDSDTDTPPAAPGSRPAPGLAATIALYTVARIGLVAVLGALLALAGVPVLLALLLALVVALPLSLVVFRGLRARLDLALAESGRRRGAQREALRARLRGDEPGGTVEGVAEPASADVVKPVAEKPVAEKPVAEKPSTGQKPAAEEDPGAAEEPGDGASDQHAEGETDPGPR